MSLLKRRQKSALALALLSSTPGLKRLSRRPRGRLVCIMMRQNANGVPLKGRPSVSPRTTLRYPECQPEYEAVLHESVSFSQRRLALRPALTHSSCVQIQRERLGFPRVEPLDHANGE